ncbi:MAG: hypothetical protein V1678_01465 [Candidatus Aenigmatarchaeota archaeon]
MRKGLIYVALISLLLNVGHVEAGAGAFFYNPYDLPACNAGYGTDQCYGQAFMQTCPSKGCCGIWYTTIGDVCEVGGRVTTEIVGCDIGVSYNRCHPDFKNYFSEGAPCAIVGNWLIGGNYLWNPPGSSGVWDKESGSCITCNGRTINKVYADGSGIYGAGIDKNSCGGYPSSCYGFGSSTCNTHNGCQWVTGNIYCTTGGGCLGNAAPCSSHNNDPSGCTYAGCTWGGAPCETACGASTECDGMTPGSCAGPGYCDANCQYTTNGGCCAGVWHSGTGTCCGEAWYSESGICCCDSWHSGGNCCSDANCVSPQKCECPIAASCSLSGNSYTCKGGGGCTLHSQCTALLSACNYNNACCCDYSALGGPFGTGTCKPKGSIVNPWLCI